MEISRASLDCYWRKLGARRSSTVSTVVNARNLKCDQVSCCPTPANNRQIDVVEFQLDLFMNWLACYYFNLDWITAIA